VVLEKRIRNLALSPNQYAAKSTKTNISAQFSLEKKGEEEENNV
jgi:hypothetical protein